MATCATSGFQKEQYNICEMFAKTEFNCTLQCSEQSVVLQESDVDHFSAEPVVDEPAENLLNYQQESEPEPTYEPEREPVRSDITEPIYVTETTVRRLSVSSPNENRNPNGHGNPKKLAGSVWPPRGDEFAKQNNSEEGGPGKSKEIFTLVSKLDLERVSDLIARFNAGNIENDSPSKVDYRYKQEYGAGGNSGKVQQSVFQ